MECTTAPKRFRKVLTTLLFAGTIAGMSACGPVPVPSAGPSAAAPAPRATTAQRGVGAFVGSSSPEVIRAYEQWLGGRVTHVSTYFAKSSWHTMVKQAPGQVRAWRGTVYQPVFALPMLTVEGGTLAQGAAGAFDDNFRHVARALVDNGQPKAVIRLGWEFNGDWYPWAAHRDPAAFAAYWRRIVTVMRTVPGAGGLRFDWNPGIGPRTVPMDAYPGDAYVDIVGMDLYDRSYNARFADPVARWNDYVERPFGLRWQRDFAAAHGKQISFPEWGLSQVHVPGAVADNVHFVQQMRAWVDSNDVEYANYFEWDTPHDGAHALTSMTFPRAREEFVRLFGRR